MPANSGTKGAMPALMRVMLVVALMLAFTAPSNAEHHARQYRALVDRQSSTSNGTIPLVISSQCEETIWPAILTQGGTGPNTGFALTNGVNHTTYVSTDWVGRVWARTNCSFGSDGRTTNSNNTACSTGDCGGVLACAGTGTPPATLAEFTMDGSSSQTFYDISLVDGYNMPLAIVLLTNNVSALEQLDQSTTNPSCVGSVGDAAAQTFDPYTNGGVFLQTTSADPLPFETNNTREDIADWCPWDLQVYPPTPPGGGVYPYPDTDVVRPAFDPCYSACAKYDEDKYCCTGSYDSSSTCTTNYYSTAAKSICPDAYSYAYDDTTSTFINPAGGGYEVLFCPGGRSTNIIASKGTSAIEHSGSSSNSSRKWLGLDGILLCSGGVALLVMGFF